MSAPQRSLLALVLCMAATIDAAAQADAAARWSALLAQSPCDWLPAATVTEIIGDSAKQQRRTTDIDDSCVWRTANGNPVLTATLVRWPSSAALTAERDAQLQQITQYGGDRFTQKRSPGGAVTAVMRKDRGRLALFPNGNTSVNAITINGHVVMKQTEAENDRRRQRATAFADALIKEHRL